MDDLELNEKIRNIQKDINEEVRLRRDMLEEIGGINKDIQRDATEILKKYVYTGNELEKQYKSLKTAREFVDGMEEGAAKETAKFKLRAARDQIRGLEKYRKKLDDNWKLELKNKNDIIARNNFIAKLMGDRFGLQLKEIEGYKTLTRQLSKMFPTMSKFAIGLRAGVGTLLLFARQLFETFDKSAAKFRMLTGIFRNSAKPLREIAEGIAIDFAHVGANIEGAYTSISALGTEMGSFYNVSKDLVQTTSLLQSQLGVSEKNTAGMLRNLAFVSKSTMSAQKSMAYFASNIASAGGVPLNDIMGDVANMSGVALSMMSKMPLEIVKSAVAARKLNSNINEIAAAGRSILNFQESVNAEMEASVLLGESINLQYARQLAYQGNAVKSAEEILRIANSIDFQKLDVFQMEAFAKATGYSVDALSKMLGAQNQLADARKSSDPNVQKQLKAYNEMKAANEAQAKASGKNLEYQVMTMANQERIVSITNKWNQILMKASSALLPMIDLSLILVGAFMDLAHGAMGWYVTLWPIVKIFRVINTLLIGLSMFKFKGLTSTFIFLGKLVGGLVGVFSNIGLAVSSVFGKMGMFGKLFGVFGRFLGPLGLVITAVQLVFSLFKNFDIDARFFGIGKALHEVLIQPFKDAWNWIMSFFGGNSPSKLGLSIINGLVSIGSMAYNALVQPFVKAWDWVKGLWGGNSPSVIGESILLGISSVTSTIFDALTSPFKSAWKYIKDNHPWAAGIASKVGSVFGINVEGEHAGVEKRASVSYNEPTKIVPDPRKNDIALEDKKLKSVTTEFNSVRGEESETLGHILRAIEKLNNNLLSGKIGVYIDGQLMSATIARQSDFQNGFGTNNA